MDLCLLLSPKVLRCTSDCGFLVLNVRICMCLPDLQTFEHQRQQSLWGHDGGQQFSEKAVQDTPSDIPRASMSQIRDTLLQIHERNPAPMPTADRFRHGTPSPCKAVSPPHNPRPDPALRAAADRWRPSVGWASPSSPARAPSSSAACATGAPPLSAASSRWRSRPRREPPPWDRFCSGFDSPRRHHAGIYADKRGRPAGAFGRQWGKCAAACGRRSERGLL
jgi:hypothetical protein